MPVSTWVFVRARRGSKTRAAEQHFCVFDIGGTEKLFGAPKMLAARMQKAVNALSPEWSKDSIRKRACQKTSKRPPSLRHGCALTLRHSYLRRWHDHGGQYRSHTRPSPDDFSSSLDPVVSAEFAITRCAVTMSATLARNVSSAASLPCRIGFTAAMDSLTLAQQTGFSEDDLTL